jgi:fermentation-respiration switch protein FrsA (DUF1100 family)
MRLLMAILIALVAVGVAVVLWVRWMEPRMLYYPVRGIAATPASLGWAFEDVRLRASDGPAIHGWWLPAAQPARSDTASRAPRTVLFLHGNAGNVSHRLDKLRILRELGVAVLIVDYRGYGLSEGRPSEAGLYRDARAAYDHLVGERGVAPADIVLYGESLGSAVATDLAGEAAIGGLVLEAAFTSAVDVGQAMFPFLPARGLMRHRFETAGKIPRVRAPILVLHSRNDEYFPLRHGERLVAAAGPPARLVVLRGGHNDAFLVSEPDYRRALADFLADLPAR